jgi:Xaa-Pro aminopeptidase
MKKELPKLIVAAPESDADQLYATRFFAPDAFIFLEQNGHRTIVLSDLEIDRGRKEAQVDEVVPLSEISELCRKKRESPLSEHIAVFLQMRKIRRVAVPSSFPLGLAAELTRRGITAVPQKGLFWVEREQKSERELVLMRKALSITETGMARGIEVLKQAELGTKGALHWQGQPLTSEILRAEIDSAILRVGGLPANTIVAGGEQACDPHERGHGPLRGRELIIIDIFPRATASGYYGDLTRTVVRGEATADQRQLWETVPCWPEARAESNEAGESGKADSGRRARVLYQPRLSNRAAERPMVRFFPRPRPRTGAGDP